MSAPTALPATAVAPVPARRALAWFAPTDHATAIRRFVWVLAIAFVAKQAFATFLFPAFSGHDEVAHFAYIQVLATEHRLPVLPDLEQWRGEARFGDTPNGDYLPDDLYPYCRFVLDWYCEPDNARWGATPPRIVTVLGELYPSGYVYTANHPPLYYAAMTPFYWLSSGWGPVAQQYLFRLLAIPLGLATVWLAFRLATTIFPGDAFLAVTVPTFVAFQPQISYEGAMVNNDIWSIALFSWMTLLLVVGIRDRFPRRTCLWLGFALGLALLTKANSLAITPVIALAVVMSVGWRNVRGWVGRGALVVAPAAAMAAPWYLWMVRTYGNLDASDQVAALQGWWNKPAGTMLGMLTDPQFAVFRFKETWGEFGWRMVPLSDGLLWAIAVPLLAAVGGLAWYLVTAARGSGPAERDRVLRPSRWQWQALVAMLALCAVAYLAVLQFGTRFALTQARYFFPVVNAAAFLTMLGLRTIVPTRARPVAQGVVFAAMVLLTVLIYTQYILPFGVASLGLPGRG